MKKEKLKKVFIELEGKKYRVRQSLDEVDLITGIEIQTILDSKELELEDKELIIALWLKCDVSLLYDGEHEILDAIFDMIIGIMQGYKTSIKPVIWSRLKPYKLKSITELTVSKYIELDLAYSENDNHLKAALSLINVMYGNVRLSTISAGYGSAFFNYVLIQKRELLKSFGLLDEPDEDDIEDSEEKDLPEPIPTVAESWGWRGVLFNMCDHKKSEVDKWLDAPIIEFFTYVKHMSAKVKEEIRNLK